MEPGHTDRRGGEGEKRSGVSEWEEGRVRRRGLGERGARKEKEEKQQWRR